MSTTTVPAQGERESSWGLKSSLLGQKICIYSGIALLVLFLSGFSLARFIVPPSPLDSARQIAQMYSQHRTAIRLGLMISMFGTALLVSWAVGVQLQLRRAVGGRSPWPLVFLLSSTLLSLEFIYLIMFWQVAAFRAQWSAEIIQMLTDLAWVPFVGITSTGILMAFSSAIPILNDRRSEPVFPRWLGYYNLWVTVMFFPGSVCVFFKTGPFAYNGLLAWYIPVGVFCTWMILNTYFALRAITRERDETVPPDAEHLAAQLAEIQKKIDRLGTSDITS